MPQKPSVYRTFVTCSDPEGVVNCGTLSKERRSYMAKRLNMSSSSRDLKEEVAGVNMNSRNSSSQLEEIEKGAQKLNKMIDSWASGLSIDGEPQDKIAKDLLRGAIELQESLNMLSKLQEASLYMSKLKRLEKLDEKRCVDEDVKKVIRDGPVRQSLLPVGYLEWGGRGVSCGSAEGQSTSSGGQSSVSFSKRGYSTDNSSVTSDNSDKNRKRTNLIAKLMGLDDRKLVQAPTGTLKKANVLTRTGNQEKKTLRELLEATQSKTDFEGKFVDRVEPVLDLVPKKVSRSRDDAEKYPPIVLMKPLHAPYKELEKGHEQCFDASEIVKELKAKNWFSQVQERVAERASLIRNEKNISFTITPQISTPELSKPLKAPVAKQREKSQSDEAISIQGDAGIAFEALNSSCLKSRESPHELSNIRCIC